MIRPLSTAALATLLLSSCVAVIGADEETVEALQQMDSDHAVEQHAEDGAKTGKEKQPKELDLDALEYAVIEAHGAIEKAAIGAEISQLEAEQRVGTASLELADAKAELEHFDTFVAPKELAERTLSVERSEARLFEAKAELAQLEDMYADEEFATSSKELVLERGRRNVNFSERSLELARESLADHESFDLAKRRAKLERALLKAELGLHLAQLRRESERVGRQQDERGRQRKLAKAEEALAEAQAKIEAGEAVAAD
ncbi:MAG: hypothetical protein P1V81_13315 [Planctomycetota bacterium]|nr:hypothetical protein [Planctomycetota bacterium]